VFSTFADLGLPDDADDREWFKICGDRNWIGLTKGERGDDDSVPTTTGVATGNRRRVYGDHS